MKNPILFLLASILLASCQPSSQPIAYGQDECAHCKMAIVEAPFAAEMVTKKGKVFKFDAIECMLDYLRVQTDMEFSMYLVHDFNAPTEWLDAMHCKYLVSEEIKSPMGGNLSAFGTEKAAQDMQIIKGGETYDWASVATLFRK
jgi:copper chaperone NosL